MISMKWVRKNNKKLLAVIGAFVMVAFLLPTGMRNRGRERAEQTVGFIVSPDGSREAVTTTAISLANQELRAIKTLGIDRFLQEEFYQNPESRFPEMAVFQLLFADSNSGQMIRGFLYQFVQQTGGDESEEMLGRVDRISGLDRSQGPLYYLLLSREAAAAGYNTPPNLIDAIFKNRVRLTEAKGYTLPSLPSVMAEFGLTEEQVRDAVGKYVAIVQYARTQTAGAAASEQQLKKVIRDQVEIENMTGKYVSFYSHLLRDKIAKPTTSQLLEHFNAYKEFTPGQAGRKNPQGFGYKLPDRVQVEYLRAGIDDAEKIVREQFQQLTPAQREQKVQQFWSKNKSLFRAAIPPDKNQPADAQKTEPPKFRDPEFDEVADKAQDMLIRQQALDKTESFMARALRALAGSGGEGTAAFDSEAYQNIPAKMNAPGEPAVTYKKTDLLSAQDIQSDPELSRTYLVRNKQIEQALIGMLMLCEPLQKKAPSHLDQIPVRLHEDVGPLLTCRSPEDVQAVYIVRIIAVDPARIPISIYDDGSKPIDSVAAETPTDKALEENGLYQDVKRDWTNSQAYLLAVEESKKFAAAAASDWDAAVKSFNKQLRTDPNQPENAGPLYESDLKQTREQITQLRQMSQKGQSAGLQGMIGRQEALLKDAVNLKQQRDKDPQAPAILYQPGNFRCMVFKNLDAAPPTQQEYLQRKALAAGQIQMQNQQALSLIHFDPESIAKRCHYEAAPTDRKHASRPDAPTDSAPEDDGF